MSAPLNVSAPLNWREHACAKCNRPLHVTSGVAACAVCRWIGASITMFLGDCAECGAESMFTSPTPPVEPTPVTEDLAAAIRAIPSGVVLSGSRYDTDDQIVLTLHASHGTGDTWDLRVAKPVEAVVAFARSLDRLGVALDYAPTGVIEVSPLERQAIESARAYLNERGLR